MAALSAQTPPDATSRPLVSSVTTTSATVSVLTPDWTRPVSAQSKPTVGSVRCQPAAFGAGVTPTTRMTGFVMSIRIVAVTGVETCPAKSVQPPEVKSVPAVSVVTVPPPVTGFSTPEPGAGSSQSKLTLVAALFQPSSVRAGVYAGSTTGFRVSSLNSCQLLLPPLPTRSLAQHPRPCAPSVASIALSAAPGESQRWSPRTQVSSRTRLDGSGSMAQALTGIGLTNQPLRPSGWGRS